MPTPEQILDGLTAAANDFLLVAVAWHVLVVLAIGLVARGWQPNERVVGLLLALPIGSAAALAWIGGNAFNGAVFSALSATLLILAARHSTDPIELPGGWFARLGALVAVFGLVYPHFVWVDSPLEYLVVAPVGVVPCPTLSLVIGLALIVRPPGRAYALVLAGAGLFYAFFGALRLGVWLDIGLAVGATALLVATLRRRRPAQRPAMTASIGDAKAAV